MATVALDRRRIDRDTLQQPVAGRIYEEQTSLGAFKEKLQRLIGHRVVSFDFSALENGEDDVLVVNLGRGQKLQISAGYDASTAGRAILVVNGVHLNHLLDGCRSEGYYEEGEGDCEHDRVENFL